MTRPLAGLVVLSALLGCRRPEARGGTLEAGGATVDAPIASTNASASASAPDPGPPVLRLSLVARPDPKGEPHAFLLIRGLEVESEQPLGSIAAPRACAGYMADGAYHVTCTPDFRKALTMRLTAAGLSSERPGGDAGTIATPSGAVLEAPDQVIGERDVHACSAPDAGVRAFAIALQANENVNARLVSLQLTAGKMSITLATVRPKCVLDSADDHVAVTCDGKSVCTIGTRGAIVDIACDRPTPARGALVVPCGQAPSLPKELGRTWANYH